MAESHSLAVGDRHHDAPESRCQPQSSPQIALSRDQCDSPKHRVVIHALNRDPLDAVGCSLDLVAMCLRMQSDDVSDRLAVMHMQFLEHSPRTALLTLEFMQQSLANTGVIQFHHLQTWY